ncbi:MAG: FAD-dependent oxidoreductase [Myxococcota bacterium]
MNPLRLLGQFLNWLLDPILSRPGDPLDRVLAYTDAKLTGRFRQIEAAPDAPPRHRFEAPEVPLREMHVMRFRLPQLRRLVGVMPGLMQRILRSGRYYDPRLPVQRMAATPELVAALEEIAHDHGAIDVAFLNEVRPHEVFKDLAVPAPGVIVFTVEMQPEPIARAPSFDTFHEVASGYRRLAEIAEALCDVLQAQGIAAYPGTALGGTTDYVALAQRAGLGGIGYHGMLLTPRAGSRVRIATVYTNLAGLPERGTGEHAWVRAFCAQCRQCVRSCPPQAIHPTPRPRTDGRGTACIDHALCRDYFAREYGCAKCIAVCPFSTAGYAAVRAGFAHAEPGRPAPVDDRDFRVAVVGAGAAGFYATRALLARTSRARIDLLERLPAPHGLVRYGVAPDHPEVRSKGFTFDEALRDPRVRFFGNVALGRDVSREELLADYDAVIYATGASASRRLGVEGEDLGGSVDAPAFVGWYNAHPDHAHLAPPLDHRSAVIVGAGNVALDVARMLAAPIEHLTPTDMAAHALTALRDSDVAVVHVVARRGPERAAFTPRELRDLAELPDVQIVVHAADLSATAPDRRVARNLELLRMLAAAEPADRATTRVTVHLHFDKAVEAIADDGSGRVGSIVLARADGVRERIACGLVIRAIGFRSVPLPGVPFDTTRDVLPSRDGRLLDDAGSVCPGEYVTGWVRRGPRGIVGTNKVDAEEVVERLLDDLSPSGPGSDLAEQLARRGVRVVTGADWERLRREERLRGSRAGRVADRRSDVAELVASLDAARPLAGAP